MSNFWDTYDRERATSLYDPRYEEYKYRMLIEEKERALRFQEKELERKSIEIKEKKKKLILLLL